MVIRTWYPISPQYEHFALSISVTIRKLSSISEKANKKQNTFPLLDEEVET